MNNLLKTLLSCLVLTIMTTTVFAQIPQELQGSWTLNIPETEKYMKTSPKWKGMDPQYLRILLNKLSQMEYRFSGDAIVITKQGNKQSIPVSLKKSEPPKYTFEGTVSGKTFTMTASFFNKTTINIRSSLTEETDYLLWSRKVRH